MTIFNGKIYGISSNAHYSDRNAERVFDIWRSEDIDVWHSGVEITWQQVVTQSFGDLQNNQDVDFLGVFNNKIYAGTNTLKICLVYSTNDWSRDMGKFHWGCRNLDSDKY